ncbi:MAG: SRPBCC domain-containing protein [Acidobacteria bacterium]|nr:MAG: SRPBCC domain-containing protein [Acidobacteriota bacterium]
MITDAPVTLSDHTVTIEQEIRVKASLETTFAALLEQLGPGFATPSGESLRLKIEPWPGGRWFRDFGNNQGHFWATVQAIKRPTLLELTGPLMMSCAVTNNIQYRLSEENGVTLIKFHHYGFGIVPASRQADMSQGWSFLHDAIQRRAEAGIQ